MKSLQTGNMVSGRVVLQVTCYLTYQKFEPIQLKKYGEYLWFQIYRNHSIEHEGYLNNLSLVDYLQNIYRLHNSYCVGGNSAKTCPVKAGPNSFLLYIPHLRWSRCSSFRSGFLFLQPWIQIPQWERFFPIRQLMDVCVLLSSKLGEESHPRSRTYHPLHLIGELA